MNAAKTTSVLGRVWQPADPRAPRTGSFFARWTHQSLRASTDMLVEAHHAGGAADHVPVARAASKDTHR